MTWRMWGATCSQPGVEQLLPTDNADKLRTQNLTPNVRKQMWDMQRAVG